MAATFVQRTLTPKITALSEGVRSGLRLGLAARQARIQEQLSRQRLQFEKQRETRITAQAEARLAQTKQTLALNQATEERQQITAKISDKIKQADLEKKQRANTPGARFAAGLEKIIGGVKTVADITHTRSQTAKNIAALEQGRKDAKTAILRRDTPVARQMLIDAKNLSPAELNARIKSLLAGETGLTHPGIIKSVVDGLTAKLNKPNEPIDLTTPGKILGQAMNEALEQGDLANYMRLQIVGLENLLEGTTDAGKMIKKLLPGLRTSGEALMRSLGVPIKHGPPEKLPPGKFLSELDIQGRKLGFSRKEIDKFRNSKAFREDMRSGLSIKQALEKRMSKSKSLPVIRDNQKTRYDALPQGTRYRDQRGKIRTKR